MSKNKVYYQGCISTGWEMCYNMECVEKENCLQFKAWEKKVKEPYEKENVLKQVRKLSNFFSKI